MILCYLIYDMYSTCMHVFSVFYVAGTSECLHSPSNSIIHR